MLCEQPHACIWRRLYVDRAMCDCCVVRALKLLCNSYWRGEGDTSGRQKHTHTHFVLYKPHVKWSDSELVVQGKSISWNVGTKKHRNTDINRHLIWILSSCRAVKTFLLGYIIRGMITVCSEISKTPFVCRSRKLRMSGVAVHEVNNGFYRNTNIELKLFLPLLVLRSISYSVLALMLLLNSATDITLWSNADCENLNIYVCLFTILLHILPYRKLFLNAWIKSHVIIHNWNFK